MRAELAAYRMQANLGRCSHADAVPVESGGVTVAYLCSNPDCFMQLPVDWR